MSQFSPNLILPLIHYLRESGSDVAAILARAGIDERCVSDAEFRLPVERADALVKAAAEIDGDPRFPIRAARHLQAGDWGVFEYLLRTSATGDEVLDKVDRFHRLLSDGEVELVRNEETKELFVRTQDMEQLSPAGAEFSMACWVAFGRVITGSAELAPRRVDFAHGAPADPSEHERFFACPIRWNAGRYAMVFVVGEHDEPPGIVDRELADLIVARAQGLLERRVESSTLESVRARILAAFRDGNPGLEQIARQLHMSPRTLRRRLEDEGVSFRALRDRLREERARELLMDPKLVIGEVAHRLGFAEASAFHRAFKRWTGLTPAEYRDASSER